MENIPASTSTTIDEIGSIDLPPSRFEMLNDAESTMRKLNKIRLHSQEMLFSSLKGLFLCISIPVSGKILRGNWSLVPFIFMPGLISFSGNQFKTSFPAISGISPNLRDPVGHAAVQAGSSPS